MIDHPLPGDNPRAHDPAEDWWGRARQVQAIIDSGNIPETWPPKLLGDAWEPAPLPPAQEGGGHVRG